MRPDAWHLTEDIDDFLDRAGDFLRSRPVLHNTPLTTLEKWRTNPSALPGPVLFGRLESDGGTQAIFYRPPTRRLALTPLSAEQTDALATHLTGLGRTLAGVTADHDTAGAFAKAWQEHTGATITLRVQMHLYRLDTLTPPKPHPDGHSRLVGEQDHEHLLRWWRELAADLGETVTIDAASWASTRFAEKRYTFWETPDGTPVSMAGLNPMVAGMVRLDPVYTPAHLRGRGYAAAVTAEVSRAALTAGATEVVLFTDAGNPTSNALYQRLGYHQVTDWAPYDFAYAEPKANQERGTRQAQPTSHCLAVPPS
ncbi:GNAT family N-acetyltransferase [Streptomyces phaeolivaceus]|uniref:GNAT family N-acetyltransferase n=1 Tax=Streptomyces phaeolivaceus TaxID=2653200 RepID=A0A5P8KDT9_9ACTN|nr:GNAT family N-acetyltransferase [Streptomyces phaeolivaceus]QFR01436.1 GNAT family N-acetyltransferase [Streptomyces phaeolivaceus]